MLPVSSSTVITYRVTASPRQGLKHYSVSCQRACCCQRLRRTHNPLSDEDTSHTHTAKRSQLISTKRLIFHLHVFASMSVRSHLHFIFPIILLQYTTIIIIGDISCFASCFNLNWPTPLRGAMTKN